MIIDQQVSNYWCQKLISCVNNYLNYNKLHALLA